MMYSEAMVAPFRAEALQIGCKELKSAEEVSESLANAETALVLVNSVCGCAARLARPALKHAVETSENAPAELFTVFAGVDTEATAQVRSMCLGVPASSPSYALFKKGKFQSLVGRQAIEGYPLEMIADTLDTAFKTYFSSN